jgi:hypothetical protein
VRSCAASKSSKAVARVGVEPQPGISMDRCWPACSSRSVTPAAGLERAVSPLRRPQPRARRAQSTRSPTSTRSPQPRVPERGRSDVHSDQLRVLGREMKTAQRRLRDLKKGRVVDVGRNRDPDKDVMLRRRRPRHTAQMTTRSKIRGEEPGRPDAVAGSLCQLHQMNPTPRLSQAD